jgi:hypothetical protein
MITLYPTSTLPMPRLNSLLYFEGHHTKLSSTDTIHHSVVEVKKQYESRFQDFAFYESVLLRPCIHTNLPYQ